ncbi:MAG: hypothetical protein K2O03_14345 [Lachnospiraceae bacterium]|nr:hypothetical protein [Lachnospiraceae bacterium]
MKIFYRLFFVAAIFFSVFVLSQLGDDFVAVGIAGVVVLIAGYLYFAQNEKEKQEERERERMELDRKLDELLNAQRAIYTITKRGNAKTEKELAATHEDLDIVVSVQERSLSENQKFAEIQVNALKTLAKYDRENTRQLALNINKNTDRLFAKLQNSSAGLQQDSGETSESLEETDEMWAGSEPGQTVDLKPSEETDSVSDQMVDLEPSVETDSEPAQTVDLEPSVETDSEPAQTIDLEPSAETDSEPAQTVDLEPSIEADSEPVQTVDSQPTIEPVPEPAKEELPPPMPVMDDPNKKMSPDEIAALFASAETGAGAQAVPEPEPTLPEPEPMAEPELSIASIPDPEQIIIPEPEAIQVPPTMDDPNPKMSPSDIEALIASLTPEE